jgi:uncharacterized protein (TIGR03435 family)
MRSMWLGVAGIVVALAMALHLVAQSAPARGPQFEVASVRALKDGVVDGRKTCDGRSAPLNLSGRISGANFMVPFATLGNLIMDAYNVRADQIAGLPAWDTCTDLYEIKATTGGKGTPPPDQVRLMLQALLADRFQLKLRHETRNLTVYQLTIAKSGSKVKMVATKAEGGTPWRGVLIRISGCLDYPVMDKTELEGKGWD